VQTLIMHTRRSPIDTSTAVAVLDVTIPVYNEERDLEECLRRLHAHLRGTFPHSFRITVADNASTDGTLKAAERVARELREAIVVHLAEKGRGNALRKDGWLRRHPSWPTWTWISPPTWPRWVRFWHH
jgi:cellulose synthase/poly-beta-1,6-N-acetylglucosamine synthase-like glycosyltransferase